MPRNPRADKSIQAFIRTSADGKDKLPAVCAGVRSRLTLYLDGELNASERQRLQTHLDTCAACREELRQFARSEQMLSGAREAMPSPPDLRAGFYARLHAAPAPVQAKINWRIAAPAFAACSLLLAAFCASFYFHPVAPGVSASQYVLPHAIVQESQARPQIALEAQKRDLGFGLPAVTLKVTQPRVSAPRKDTVAIASAGTYNENPGFAAAKARTWSLQPSQAQSAPRPLRRRRAGDPVYAVAATPLPAISTLRLKRLHSAPVQIARLSLVERETNGSGEGEAKTYVFGALHKLGIDVRAKSQQDRNSLAYQSLAFGRESLSERGINKDTNFIDYSGAVGKARGETADVLLREESFALAASSGDRSDREGAGFGEATAGADGVSFQVRDTRRGFVSGTRAASEVQRRDGRQVLSIHMEDDDARMLETENTGGETSGKTGNQR